jgi:hypothetical protein
MALSCKAFLFKKKGRKRSEGKRSERKETEKRKRGREDGGRGRRINQYWARQEERERGRREREGGGYIIQCTSRVDHLEILHAN